MDEEEHHDCDDAEHRDKREHALDEVTRHTTPLLITRAATVWTSDVR
jgi:hypothetical protein